MGASMPGEHREGCRSRVALGNDFSLLAWQIFASTLASTEAS